MTVLWGIKILFPHEVLDPYRPYLMLYKKVVVTYWSKSKQSKSNSIFYCMTLIYIK